MRKPSWMFLLLLTVSLWMTKTFTNLLEEAKSRISCNGVNFCRKEVIVEILGWVWLVFASMRNRGGLVSESCRN